MTRPRRRGRRTLLLPSLQTQVEDGDTEREEEEDVGDGESSKDEKGRSVAKAAGCCKTGGVGGGKDGGIGGVDGHNCWDVDVMMRRREDGNKKMRW